MRGKELIAIVVAVATGVLVACHLMSETKQDG
jgi:hypothetical protein